VFAYLPEEIAGSVPCFTSFYMQWTQAFGAVCGKKFWTEKNLPVICRAFAAIQGLNWRHGLCHSSRASPA
jgi:hypothetical protein